MSPPTQVGRLARSAPPCSSWTSSFRPGPLGRTLLPTRSQGPHSLRPLFRCHRPTPFLPLRRRPNLRKMRSGRSPQGMSRSVPSSGWSRWERSPISASAIGWERERWRRGRSFEASTNRWVSHRRRCCRRPAVGRRIACGGESRHCAGEEPCV